MTHQFDKFAQKHPAQKHAEPDGLLVALPVLGCSEEEVYERAVPEERPLQNSCLVNSIGTPGLPSVSYVSKTAFTSF